MTRLSLSREIYCPADEVFAYHADLSHASQHWTNVVACWRLDGGAGVPPVGTAFAWRYRMYGVEFSGTGVIRECEPGRRFAFDTSGGLRASVDCDYTPLSAHRSRVEVRVDYDVPMGLIGRAVDRLLVESRNAADGERAMDRLAARIEAEAAARLDMQPA